MFFFSIIFGYKFNDCSDSEKNILTANRGETQVLFVDWCQVSTTQFIHRSHWILISRSDNYFDKDWVFCQCQSICVMTTDIFFEGRYYVTWVTSFSISDSTVFCPLFYHFDSVFDIFCFINYYDALYMIVILHVYSRTEMCPCACLVRLWYLWLEGLSDGTRLDRTLSYSWNDWFR